MWAPAHHGKPQPGSFGKAPLIIYVPDASGHHDDNTFTLANLASHGFVLASLSDPFRKENTAGGSKEIQRVERGIKTASLFVDALQQLQATAPAGSWTASIDLTKLGIMGYAVGGVVAAEARAAGEIGELEDGEEAVYRLSEAAAARHQTLGKVAARAGRRFLADVEKARRPSHVPLYRLQRALAEELALGHSIAALCSRSEGFSDSCDESKLANLLYRRLGLLGHRDCNRQLRYARVAPYVSAVLLCKALDVAPERVGL